MSALAVIRDPTAAEVEIEQAALGLLLEGAETAWFVLDHINPEDMLESLHQRVVASVRRVLDAGGEPNPLTVAAAMASDAGLNELGGADYFRNIQRMRGRNAKMAAEICAALSDQAQRRALGHEIAQTEGRLRDVMTPARDILAEHQQAIAALTEGKPEADDPVSLYEAAKAVCERLDAPQEERRPMVPFGIAGLDDDYGGMTPGDLIILAGRTGMGKSAVALAIADAAASKGHGVLFESLEMRKHQLAERWLSYRAYCRGEKTPYSLIRLNRVHETGRDVLADEAAKIGQLPLIIDDRRGQTLSQIGIRARRVQAKLKREGRPLGLLVIDHLQRIAPDGAYRGNKVAEITEIARGLKNLAGVLDIPILALSQFSRAVEGRDDKLPMLSDLRESGSIEEEADQVFLLYRPEYYARKNEPDREQDIQKHLAWLDKLEHAKGHIFIDAAKVRHGEDKKIKAKCDIAYNWIGERME